MVAAASLGAVLLLAAAGLAWTVHLVHISSLDASELAGKLAVPDPVSALDWPELRVRAIVPQPGGQPLILLLVGWPAHPGRAATLLLAIDSGDDRAVPLLSLWCATQAPVSPTRRDGAGLELRRRQSLDRVHAVLIAEDYKALGLQPHPPRQAPRRQLGPPPVRCGSSARALTMLGTYL